MLTEFWIYQFTTFKLFMSQHIFGKLKPYSVTQYWTTNYSHCRHACSIPLGDEVVLTGGWDTLTRVSLYNTGGWVRDLSSLNTGRWSHGCTSYSTGGEQVRLAICHASIIYPPADSPCDRRL